MMKLRFSSIQCLECKYMCNWLLNFNLLIDLWMLVHLSILLLGIFIVFRLGICMTLATWVHCRWLESTPDWTLLIISGDLNYLFVRFLAFLVLWVFSSALTPSRMMSYSTSLFLFLLISFIFLTTEGDIRIVNSFL